MKIVCFLASLAQARCVKRVNALYENGFEVEVYGHSRGLYNAYGYPEKIKIVDWGEVESGKGYFSKFWSNYFLIKEIVNRHQPDTIYYAFSFDISLCMSLLGKKRFVYEISDVVYAYFKNTLLRLIFKHIDRWLIKKSYKTVVTSEGFVDYILERNSSLRDKIIVQPNKVSSKLASVDRVRLSNLKDKKITFSYIGLFRYKNTVFRLARVIGEYYPQFEFYFYGNSKLTPLAIELSEKYSNVKYFGPFKSPDDLEKIYSTVDVVAACYDNTLINEQIAEPNKLYEAICFCRPIIVSSNTFLGKKVEKLGVGYAIDASNDKSIRLFLDNLDLNDLEEISNREYSMNRREFVDSPQKIISALKVFS